MKEEYDYYESMYQNMGNMTDIESDYYDHVVKTVYNDQTKREEEVDYYYLPQNDKNSNLKS